MAASPVARPGEAAHRGQRGLHGRAPAIARAELGDRERGPALTPCGMLDEGDVDRGAREEAQRQEREEVEEHDLVDLARVDLPLQDPAEPSTVALLQLRPPSSVVAQSIVSSSPAAMSRIATRTIWPWMARLGSQEWLM